jgi:hypothetical protein
MLWRCIRALYTLDTALNLWGNELLRPDSGLESPHQAFLCRQVLITSIDYVALISNLRKVADSVVLVVSRNQITDVKLPLPSH